MKRENAKQTIPLKIDLYAETTGFRSATKPTQAHHRIAKYFSSPLLMGPPPSDLLLELVMHMFTDEEAEIVTYLPPLRSRTAEKVAQLSKRPVADVGKILHELAFNKKVILAAGNPRKFAIIPIVPGAFEMALMTPDLRTRNSWHVRFAELFEHLWETGYLKDYPGNIKFAPVRYLPVGGVTNTLYMAWPSDLLEEVLEPYNAFAVGHCQCRLAMQMVGKGCGRSTENCVAMGSMVKPLVERGMMREIDREEAIRIKHEAEKEGSVTWMMNEVGLSKANGSCSCCGCCCHGLRILNEFNTPGLISRPHFMPAYVLEKCKRCKSCVTACPMDAWSFVSENLVFNSVRCIGCGLCVVSCKSDALKMTPVQDAVPMTSNKYKFILGATSGYLANSVRVWAKRLFMV